MGSPLLHPAFLLVGVHVSLLKELLAGGKARNLSLPAVILLWGDSFPLLTTKATGGGLVKISLRNSGVCWVLVWDQCCV